VGTAGRVILVAALVASTGLVASINPADVEDSRHHGCSEPWAGDSGVDGGPPAAAARADAASTSTGTDGTGQMPEIFDSFDGPAGAPPNPDRWTVVEGKGWDRGDQEYTSDNAVLDGQGHLMLRAQKSDTGYSSGRVETRRKANFGYGTLIVRIKMPSGAGLWPAFWLMGADEDRNPWPGAGEIDVVELVSDPRTWYSSIHGPISGVPDYLQAQLRGEGPDLSADFHDYWVIRKENAITVGIDDTVWGTFTPDSLPPTAEWVYNKPFCVILNLAVGGEWAGPPDESTRFPATMLVDYVHWEPAR